MNINQILAQNDKFKNELLGRMVSDCKYYLGYGYRSSNSLWAKDERCQIEYMFTILLSISNNYGDVTVGIINKYAELMGVDVWTRREFYGRWVSNGVVFEIFREWGDEKGDRLVCFTYHVGRESSAKLFAHTDRYINIMDFLLYCQYNYKY